MKTVTITKTILNGVGIKTANFTAATTDVITSNAHGLKDGDMVVLTTTGTLPAGLAIGTVYYVIQAATNTFKLAATANGMPVDITDTGTGTHTFTMHDVGYAVQIKGYTNNTITICSDGGGDAAMTIKCQVSTSDECPDFSAAQTPANSWDYCNMSDLEDKAAIAGDTGLAFSSADDHRNLNLDANHAKWVNFIISSWTAGEITIRITSSSY